MTINEVSFLSMWIALFAGVISFLSPCVFPLVPAFLAQLTGANINNNEIAADRKLILSRSIGFIIGFTSIFLVLGASSTFVGRIFIQNMTLLEQLGGIVIVLFGLQLTGVFSFSFLMKEKRFHQPKKAASFLRSISFGLVFAAAWSPCIGLVLGSILALASSSSTMWGGMTLLLIYSIGLGIPFLLAGLLYSKSLNKMRNVNRYLPVIQKSSGVVMIILGIMLFTGLFNRISAYLANYIPFGI
ncbi:MULTISPECIES: cytochrome c biogenesis CcdA family protein [Alteribacter]|uniref:Cytochrome c biogenesis protein CcdA n=1 Tax=Alteribacter keqinensis TaxID=2483800 RepID=A0A3M7TSV7_9BACI|nr:MULTISPECIES: cytochrome c biogenesis protein CcdA [Alteribacter]MBM7097789.1 cytochrome c biogenesis protein CcdA [Alteribacter salitolerans]RNA68720.1 cytochrome c biogenesis protein CcdA [Alteribacter keqinensis]